MAMRYSHARNELPSKRSRARHADISTSWSTSSGIVHRAERAIAVHEQLSAMWRDELIEGRAVATLGPIEEGWVQGPHAPPVGGHHEGINTDRTENSSVISRFVRGSTCVHRTAAQEHPMPTVNTPARTAVVTGASRSFGRAIAVRLASTGVHVVGVSRDEAVLEDLRARLGSSFTPVVAHVTRDGLATRLIAEHRPSILASTPAPPRMRQRSRTRHGRRSARTGTSTSGTSSSSSEQRRSPRSIPVQR